MKEKQKKNSGLRPGEKKLLFVVALIGAGVGLNLLFGGEADRDEEDDDDDDEIPPTAPARAALREAAAEQQVDTPPAMAAAGELALPPAPMASYAQAIERLSEQYPKASYRQLRSLAADIAERRALRRAAVEVYRTAHARPGGEG